MNWEHLFIFGYYLRVVAVMFIFMCGLELLDRLLGGRS